MSGAKNEATAGLGGYPRQIPFIIANEICERFSFYGMRNILTMFLVSHLLLEYPPELRESQAKEVFHIFVMGVYFFPLLGGWLADRYFGKYRTILWLSMLYCVGHLFLALFESNAFGFYSGLFLIALGSGGIKPCVSSFVGDQFDQKNKDKARVIFDFFYWSINFGSFFASLLIPLVLSSWGPAWAFGIPGVLMAMATFIFWLGRHRYVKIEAKPAESDDFWAVMRRALFDAHQDGNQGRWIFGFGLGLACLALIFWSQLGAVAAICLACVSIMACAGIGTYRQLPKMQSLYQAETLAGVKAVLKILVLFALVTPFWSLFDQKASTWVLQARSLALPGWSWLTSPSQMQALNPLLVVLLIPFNNSVLYPLLARRGIAFGPLARMSFGIALSGVSWLVIGAIQILIDRGHSLSILWQILPYVILTLSEVFVSATGLEFAYSQAPQKMKGTIMSFWSLSVTVGSLWVLLVNSGVRSPLLIEALSGQALSVVAFQMFFFAIFAFLAAAGFYAFARRYTLADHYRKA